MSAREYNSLVIMFFLISHLWHVNQFDVQTEYSVVSELELTLRAEINFAFRAILRKF